MSLHVATTVPEGVGGADQVGAARGKVVGEYKMAKCSWAPFRAHRNFFGAPGTGVHSHRFLGLAVVDLLLTLLVAMVTTWTTGTPLVITTIAWLTLGLLLHTLFGVNTSAVTWLGLACGKN